MSQTTQVLEYKCPCCDAGLVFGPGIQQLKCEYCDNTFELDTVKAYNDSQSPAQDAFQWEQPQSQEWTEDQQQTMQVFSCPSCGGEILSDEVTAATFCPFCDNPTILPSRVSGGLKPDGMLPFMKTRDEARAAFLKLCKGKKLLPRGFTSEQRLEKITGMYVPYWLYDCSAEYDGSFKATRIRSWSDSRYHYTKTDHYLLRRRARADFEGIPMDASSKMEDVFMESIEPFDYGQMVDFDMAYLTGYFADKYDVPSENGEDRIRQRVEQSMSDAIAETILGYTTAVPTNRRIDVQHGNAKYVLLPVWMLNTNYRGKIYTFMMNGQTGKITGSLPVCWIQTAKWFAGICAGVTLAATLFQFWLTI